MQLFQKYQKSGPKIFSERGEQKSKRMAELESKVDRCLRRCDSDLERFGNEIELEQPGIREKLDEDAMNLEPRDKNHSEATDEDDYQVCFILQMPPRNILLPSAIDIVICYLLTDREKNVSWRYLVVHVYKTKIFLANTCSSEKSFAQ